MTQLELPLKAEWYEMIESGVKTEEYREVKPYWAKRLTEEIEVGIAPNGDPMTQRRPKVFDTVRFRFGYTKRTMTFECKDINIGVGRSDWGAPRAEEVYIIRLGKRIN